jgi:hypothetical protein
MLAAALAEALIGTILVIIGMDDQLATSNFWSGV